MGDAIARAGMAVADGLSEAAQLKMQRAQLEMENRRLEMLAQESKLSPNVPGIYGNVSNRNTSRASGASDQRDSDVSKELFFRSLPIHGRYNFGGLGFPHIYSNERIKAVSDTNIDAHCRRKDVITEPLYFHWLGATFRPTGTTSKAELVETVAGDLGGSAWGAAVVSDYVIGTYSHNFCRPFAKWIGFYPDESQSKKPVNKKPTRSRKPAPDKKPWVADKKTGRHFKPFFPTVYD